jgi:hypothetical protein
MPVLIVCVVITLKINPAWLAATEAFGVLIVAYVVASIAGLVLDFRYAMRRRGRRR